MSEQTGLRIMVAMPTHDMMSALTAYDLAQMMAHTAANYVGPDRPIEGLSLTMCTGTYVHTARQDLAELAVEQGAHYVLFVDSDHRFPKDALIRLLKHNEDVVGINYSNRGVPPDFVAIKRISPPEPLVTDGDSEGLEEVEAMGLGLTLIRTKVLRALDPPERRGEPWFWYDWLPEQGQQVGEDVYFCQIVRDAGFTVYVDHDLSKDCAHIGAFEFTTDHPLAMREGVEA